MTNGWACRVSRHRNPVEGVEIVQAPGFETVEERSRGQFGHDRQGRFEGDMRDFVLVEHLRTRVRSDNGKAVFREEEGVAAGTAADLEKAAAGRRVHQQQTMERRDIGGDGAAGRRGYFLGRASHSVSVRRRSPTR
jgi:hypothetical protein